MKSLFELGLIGLCVVTVTLLASWAGWELRRWWQTRRRRPSAGSARDDD